MYYKVELRIYGKYFNDGFVNISDDKFEGFLTFDYISGYVKEIEGKKLLCVNLMTRKFFEEDSKLEFPDTLMMFKIDEFTVPCTYEATTKVDFCEKDKMYNEIKKTYSIETLLELEFIKKVSKTGLPDFEEQLERVKEGLKL